MAVETERKFLDVDLDELRKKLAEADAISHAPHFETNILLDYGNGSLYARDELLRLRRQEWPEKTACVLTFKKPLPKIEFRTDSETCAWAGENAVPASRKNANKEREELETAVGDMDICLKILENLGFQVWARYEKIRESYVLRLPEDGVYGENGQSVKVELDHLCFSDVVEIEGSPELIDPAARLLGLDKFKKSITNYHKLYQQWRRENGLPPEPDFVFEPGERSRLRKQLGLDCG